MIRVNNLNSIGDDDLIKHLGEVGSQLTQKKKKKERKRKPE